MRDASQRWTDRELIERIRRGERLAEHEFFWRFQPVLVRTAHHSGVQPALREESVVECLDDALMYFLRPAAVVPRSLAGFLTTFLRYRICNARRAERRRARQGLDAVRETAVDGEYVVLDTCSEAAVRDSRPAIDGTDAAPLSPALELLADALDEGLSEEERMLLSWLGEWVPQQRIAEWLGLEHGALRKRIQRLRERLKEVSYAFADHLDPDDRQQLREFFRRTGVTDRRRGNE